jgi:DNA-binding NarL/FixJ family response regulator
MEARLRAEGYSIARPSAGPHPESPDGAVLIFDVDAAGIDRIAAPARRCKVRLVGLIREESSEQARNGRGAGLSAVLMLHALTSSRLRSCIRTMRDGGGSVPPELLCQLLAAPGDDADDRPRGELTGREFDVLRLLADGDSTRDIATRLSYSERTVKNIVHDLLAKLNCRTRAQAVAFAARRGLI